VENLHNFIKWRNDAHADGRLDLSGRCSYRKVVNRVAIPVDFDHLLKLRVSNHGHWVGQRISKLQDESDAPCFVRSK